MPTSKEVRKVVDWNYWKKKILQPELNILHKDSNHQTLDHDTTALTTDLRDISKQCKARINNNNNKKYYTINWANPIPLRFILNVLHVRQQVATKTLQNMD